MIAIENLTKRRGDRLILTELTFTAAQGRITAFLGPNGAGKSSTLRILLGLDHATSGTALINGKRYREHNYPLRTIGSMLNTSGAHPSRTVRNHLAWVARSNGIPKQRIDEVLDEVGLGDRARRRIKQLSLGMGQRLGLATALLGEPELLILDEPVNGMDPDGIRWMRNRLRAHTRCGGTVLLSSHLMSEVAEIADDLVVISGGRIVTTGPLEEVTAGHSTLEDAFFALTTITALDER